MTDDELSPEAKADSAGLRFTPDRRMLESLVCPMTQGPLELNRERNELVSRGAGLAYPIRDGIPVMLVSEARRLAD
jgi:uncharacterized protein